MPGMITTKYSEAAAEAIREALRAERRAKLKKEIDNWNKELSKVTTQISDLEKEKQNLETYLGEWEEQKRKYNGNTILSEVVIVNLFEGICADNIKDDFAEAVAAMDWTYNGVNVMKGDVGTQIAKLHQYEAVINTKLTSLQNELDAI